MASQISRALLWSFLSGPHPLELFVGMPPLSMLVILLLLRSSVGRQLLYVDERISVVREPGGWVSCQLACFRLWNHDFVPTWEPSPVCFSELPLSLGFSQGPHNSALRSVLVLSFFHRPWSESFVCIYTEFNCRYNSKTYSSPGTAAAPL